MGEIMLNVTGAVATKIDATDLPLLNGWKLCLLRGKNRFYVRARRSQDGQEEEILLHRLIMSAPAGIAVDHINGDSLDNRRSNLRLCSLAENNRNHAGRRSNNTSGYIGVCYVKSRNRWLAHITFGKLINLGHYDTPEEAARVRDEAARKFHGEFATLNFPVEQEACA